MHNIFSFLSYLWPWNARSTSLNKEQKIYFKELQGSYESDFANVIVGFDAVMGRLINSLCFWTAAGFGNIVVVSGDKEKTKRVVIKRIIETWVDIHSCPVSTVNCDYYTDPHHHHLIQANLPSSGVVWLQNVDPEGSFIRGRGRGGGGRGGGGRGGGGVLGGVWPQLQAANILCVIELVPTYTAQSTGTNLCGLPVGDWVDLSTPDRSKIEEEIKKQWKNINDNDVDDLPEDTLSSVVDDIISADCSRDNLVNVVTNLSRSREEGPKKKAKRQEETKRQREEKREEETMNPLLSDDTCRVNNERGSNVTIIRDSNVGNVIYSAPTCFGSDEATVGNVDYELSQVSNGSLHYSRQRQQAWAR